MKTIYFDKTKEAVLAVITAYGKIGWVVEYAGVNVTYPGRSDDEHDHIVKACEYKDRIRWYDNTWKFSLNNLSAEKQKYKLMIEWKQNGETLEIVDHGDTTVREKAWIAEGELESADVDIPVAGSITFEAR